MVLIVIRSFYSKFTGMKTYNDYFLANEHLAILILNKCEICVQMGIYMRVLTLNKEFTLIFSPQFQVLIFYASGFFLN